MTNNDQIDNYAVYSPVGRFDAHGAEPAKEWLRQKQESGVSNIIINLQEVHFIDSAALAALVSGMKSCRVGGGDLVLCSLQQPVAIIFELTKLDQAFGIYIGVPEAAQALSQELRAAE